MGCSLPLKPSEGILVYRTSTDSAACNLQGPMSDEHTRLYSLVTPTNTKQNITLYYKVSLARWLSSSLAGSLSNYKSWVRIPAKTKKFFKLANSRYTNCYI